MWNILRTRPIRIARWPAAAVVAAALSVGLVASPGAGADAPSPQETFRSVPIGPEDFTLGSADAPVTIVEYASLTCPHCAHFNTTVLPEIKKAYIDTGKVRLVYRDFPLDRFALMASMLARCSGRDRYFGFVELLFKDQRRWATASDPRHALSQLARLGGMPQAKFDACLKDDTLQKAVLQQRLTASRELKISSTPTLIINGNKYGGGLTFEQVKAIIEPMLSKS